MKSKAKINRRLHVISEPPKQEEAPFFDPCVRFQKKYGVKSDMNRIVAYMYLKDQNYDINKSRAFSQKRICKFDTTQTTVGPPQAKFIKIITNHPSSVNGWISGGEQKYQFQNGWKTSIDDICIDQQYEAQLSKHFKMKESQLKHDYKAKIDNMNKYFKEIDEMFKIKDKKESVKQLRAIYKKSREEPQPYVKYQGQRFFEILPLMKKRTNTVIEEFNCFKPLCSLELKEKQKYLDDLFKHLNKKDQKKQDEEQIEQKQVQEPCIDYQDQDNQNATLKRAFSQNEDLTAEAQAFNQNHYLFEVKDVNSFGQQIRMNKMNQIMNEMFKSQRNFQKDLKSYASKHLNTSSSGDVSLINISQMQQSIENYKQKELKRMHKSCEFITNRIHPKTPAMKSSAFQTTATSNQFKF